MTVKQAGAKPSGRPRGAGILLCLALLLAPPAAAQSDGGQPGPWQGFQGDAGHSGYSASLAPAAYQPLWVARPDPPTVDGQATAVVYDGRLIISDISPTTIPACRRVEDGAILAYDPVDGSQVWRVPTDGKLVGAPHLAEGLVYAVVWDCPSSGNDADNSTLYAIDARDGRVVWQQALTGTEAGPPVAAGGLVLVPGRKLQALLAYDALSGQPRWQAPLRAHSRNTLEAPAVLGDSVFVVDGEHLYAFDLDSGAERWRLDADGKGHPWRYFHGTPIAADGMVMVVGQSNPPGPRSHFAFEAYDAATGGFISGLSLADDAWANAGWGASYHGGRAYISGAWKDAEGAFQRGIIAFDVVAGGEAWRAALGRELFPPAIDGAGRLLVTGRLGRAWILDAGNGAVLWDSRDTHIAEPWPNLGNDGQPRAGSPSREEWLPDRWGLETDGSPLLLDQIGRLGELPPVLADGMTFGKVGFRQGPHPPYLVAFGPDTTPPSVEIRRPAEGYATLGREHVYGTVFDYNLLSWRLEYGSGAEPQSWILLKESDRPQQGHADMLNGLGPWDGRELGSGIWTLRLTATDITGLTSTTTTQIRNDKAPPAIAIEWPRDGMTLDAAEIRITGTASDDFEVREVRISAPGGADWRPAEGTAQWSFDFTASSLDAGEEIVIQAMVTDGNGNVASDEVRVRLAPLRVALSDHGRRLTSNYPIFISPGLGRDHDGLLDQWEEAAIQLTAALIEVDEEEDWLRKRFTDHVAQFVRVRTYEPGPRPPPQPADDCGLADYRVSVLTSAIEFAGTDANVVLQLLGEDGCGTGEILLDDAADNFEAGVAETFLLRAPNVAALEQLALRHDNAGGNPGWHVASIVVENLTEGWRVTFDPETWLQGDRPCWVSSGICPGTYAQAPLDPRRDLLDDPPPWVVFQFVLRWAMDYGRFGIEAHDIDTEKYFVAWRVVDPRTLELAYVFTSSHRDPNAHHSVWHAWDRLCNVTDVANLWNEAEWEFEEYDHSEVICGALEFTPEGRLVLYPSEDKHALYPSEAVCESVSLVANPGPNAGEDCGWQPSSNPLSDFHWDDSDFAGDPRYRMGGRWLLDAVNTGDEPYILVGEGEILGLPVPTGTLQDSDENPPQILRRAMAARYRIEISTAAIEDSAGLDRIDLKLTGSSGSSGTLAIHRVAEPPRHANFAGDFTGGGSDVFYAIQEELGALQYLELALFSRDRAAVWQPEWVRITEIDSNETWYFPGGEWLAGSATGSTATLYPDQAGSPGARYRIAVLTGERRNAGTDAAVTVNLIGSDGRESGPLLLDAPDENDFERGSLDTFTLWSPTDITELGAVVLTQDGTGAQPGWYLRELRVEHLGSGAEWVFYAGRWLADDEPGGPSAELLPSPDCGLADYRIRILTSGIDKAGTDAEVFLDLQDSGGCRTGELYLDNAADTFEAGGDDTFLVRAANIADLERLLLRHDNSGDNPGWHVSSIVVENLTEGWRTVFNPGVWLEGDVPCWASEGTCP